VAVARPRIPAEHRPKQALGEAKAVTVSLRVDVETMVRLERILHQRVVSRIRQGERGSESASSLIREAMEDWLDRQEAATRRKKKA
jgi:hypothetical protein